MIKTAHRIANVEEYYFSKKLAEVRSLDSRELPVINLGIGSPDLSPSHDTVEALTQSARNPAHHGYQNYKGIPALRQAIASFYERIYGVRPDPEKELLPLMGSKEGIFHVTMAFVNEGEEVLIPDPGYPTYAAVARLAGAKVKNYALREDKDWAIDMEALRKADLSKVKLMWVNYPHMPTGKIASHAELAELVALARQHQFLIVNDNPYSLILNDQPLSILSVPGAIDTAMELNSLSKSHNMAGWRIGWIAGSPEHIEAVVRVKSNMDSGMFLGLQHAAIEALRNEQNWFEELNTVYKGRSVVARRILDVLGCSYAERQSGLFVWAKAPRHVTNVEHWLDEILYATKIFITPGFVFGNAGSGHVRISLCAPVEKLEEAHSRLQQWAREKKAAHHLTAKENA